MSGAHPHSRRAQPYPDVSETTERTHLLCTQLSQSSHASSYLPQSGDVITEPYDGFKAVQDGQRHRRYRPSRHWQDKFVFDEGSLSKGYSPLRVWGQKAMLVVGTVTMVVTCLTLSVVLWLKLEWTVVGTADIREPVELPSIARSWAAYTPYYPVRSYEHPPADCRVTQVNIIQRHGARYPTIQATPFIRSALDKLKSVNQYTDRRLDFLKNYTYTLGVEDLVAFGALEAQLAGKIAYERYSHLFSHDDIPFVRTSGDRRVVDSARNWTLGFSVGSDHKYEPPVSVIIKAGFGKNNTLSGRMCPNADPTIEYTLTWMKIFGPPIADRLNAQAPGAGITFGDVAALMSLCAFDTVAASSLSPFCGLFSPEEFADYEYLGDVQKYYKTGYGQRLGRVQGVGYVNELIARLTNSPVRDNTQTNRTLDASPKTFPLNRRLYADFSHDDQMAAIYAAMGIFRQRHHLDPTNTDPKRTWVTSQLTPFGARMVIERLECDGHTKNARHSHAHHLDGSTTRKKRRGSYVRILVNDAIQPLELCGGDRDQLCELGKFVKSQRYARRDGDGDFQKCFN